MTIPPTKVAVLIFNMMTLVFGMAVIFMGLISCLKLSLRAETPPNTIDFSLWISRIILITGVVIAVASLFGFCGSLVDNKIFLRIYLVLLVLFAIVQLVLCGARAFLRESIWDFDKKMIKEMVAKYDTTQGKNFIDDLQFEQKCCGLDGPSDYTNSTRKIVPPTCCGQRNGTCDPSLTYKHGCWGRYKSRTEEREKTRSLLLLVFGILEVTIYCVIEFGYKEPRSVRLTVNTPSPSPPPTSTTQTPTTVG